MTRYTRDVNWKFLGDVPLAMQHIPQARVVVGQMLDILGTVPTKTLSRQIAPGVTVRVDGWGSQLVVTINAAHTPDSPGYVPPSEFATWVPEGFVFYPASDESPNGWGLPIKPLRDDAFSDEEQVFSPLNLAPGLDVERWTPGGALGEVLVTRKPDAGYPPQSTANRQVITMPPLYHPDYGPHPTKLAPTTRGPWQAYRLEFIDFDANSPDITTGERAERKAWKREMFGLFNQHRVSIGRDPVAPPIRGDYDSAQATCEWTVSTMWFGHSCKGYPPTWRDVDDRGLKTGTKASRYATATSATMGVTIPVSQITEILTSAGTTFDVQYADETGNDVVVWDAYIPYSPRSAFDSWMNSPPHKSAIEDVDFDVSDAYGVWVQVGCAVGSWAAHFTMRYQWVQHGNVYWHSSHDEIPTLSWFGYMSKNLHDETWPVAFAVEVGDNSTARIWISAWNSLISPGDDGVTNTSWYQRLRASGASRQGVLGTSIFARGRTIAIAPDSGYVLAAAIQKLGDHDVQYRLVAICVHKADEPEDIWDGLTPKVRVWWVDLPPHVLETFNGVPTSVVAGNPHTVIRTKYGVEPIEWPWIEANSPYSWRGGDVVDMSSSNLGRPPGDLLSYASMWEFNPEGTKAVCLRYSFNKELFDWHALGDDQAFCWVNEVFQAGRVGSMTNRSYISLADSNGGIEEFRHIAGTPVFCEMTVGFDTNDGAMHAVSFWTHNPAGGFVPSEPLPEGDLDTAHWYINEVPALYLDNTSGAWPTSKWLWEWPMRVIPIVAYYGSDGAVRAVYDIEANMRSAFVSHNSIDHEHNYGQTINLVGNRLAPGVLYRGVATGPAVVNDAECRAMLDVATLYSAEIGHNGVNTMADYPIVLHASDGHLSFVALGVDSPLVTTTSAPVNFPFNPEPYLSLYAGQTVDVAPNPDWAPWDSVETTRQVIQLDVWHNGSRVHTSRYPNPYKFHVHRAWSNPWNKYTRMFWGYKGSLNFSPRWNTAWGVIGGFATNRDGDWAMCATFGIQRGTAFFRVGGTDAEYTATNVDGVQYSFRFPYNPSSSVYNTSGPYNVGGFMAASFATQDQLASMMQIPGASPRANYVGVV